jgi:hypothetical protein
MSEKIWIDGPDVMSPATPEVEKAPEAVTSRAEEDNEALPAAPEVMTSRADLPRDEPERSKPVRSTAKSPDDLPRGERWKRRLPRMAW